MNDRLLTKLLGVRFDPATFKIIQKVATAQGISACDFVRISVRRELARLSFLPADEKKALEVVEQ